MADYLYASARVRALENALIGKERMELLVEARDVDALTATLRELGVELLTDDAGAPLFEETLLHRLRTSYGEAVSLSENAPALRLWLYPYDGNNVKAAIKCFSRGIDARPMMFDFGTVSADEIIRMVETGDFSALPQTLREGAVEATAEYARTKNPQVIDLILDRAVYALMLEDAKESKLEFAISLVQSKIDLVNLLTCVRILRMNNGEIGRRLLRQAFLDGGSISEKQIWEWFDGGEAFLWERLSYSAYDSLAARVAESNQSLSAIEREMDSFWMRRIQGVKFVPYGPEVLIAYLLAQEYEVRNLRICIAGKRERLSVEMIRERMRDSYV
ncbi:MAG: V-type ATPase subunit [Clostridia bacterium]|nr:V-type ATPase subunit [Clostridia bacterium]